MTTNHFNQCDQKAPLEGVQLDHQIHSRHGTQHMRFPSDSDTTRRLKRLHLITTSRIPWWRRLLRYLN